MIDSLTTRYYSHSHMIHRQEAQVILGEDHVAYADSALSAKLDRLLGHMRTISVSGSLSLNRFAGDDIEKEARLIGGCVESREWGYRISRSDCALSNMWSRRQTSKSRCNLVNCASGSRAAQKTGMRLALSWLGQKQDAHRSFDMTNLENFVFFLTTAEERNICFIGERQQPTAVRHPSEGGSDAHRRLQGGCRYSSVRVGPLP